MAWYELAHNPDAIRSLFSTKLELDDIYLFAVEMDREGPAIRLRFDLKQFPDSPPERWRAQGYNRAQATVEFFDIDALAIAGWSRQNSCRLDVVREDGRVLVSAQGTTCSVTFKAGFFRIGGVSGYVDSIT